MLSDRVFLLGLIQRIKANRVFKDKNTKENVIDCLDKETAVKICEVLTLCDLEEYVDLHSPDHGGPGVELIFTLPEVPAPYADFSARNLFAGQNKQNGNWVSGDLIHAHGRTYIGELYETICEVDPNSVIQIAKPHDLPFANLGEAVLATAKIQADYADLVRSKGFTKKAVCDLVVPYRDKHHLSDSEALRIVRNEMGFGTLIQTLITASEGKE